MILLLENATSEKNHFGISIHKVFQEELALSPGEAKVVELLVFPRRLGMQRLDSLQLQDITKVEKDKKIINVKTLKFYVTD